MGQRVRRLQLLRLGLTALSLAAAAAAATPAPGTLAPDFTLRSAGGPNLRLAELRGEVVLLAFWGTWCRPCREQLPALDRLRARHPAAVVLAVAIDEDPAYAAEVATRLRTQLRVLHDDERAAAQRYQLDAVPTLIVLDRDGRVQHVARALDDAALAAVELTLKGLLTP